MGAHFGCSDGAFENGGDFGERVSFEATQEEDFAIILVEFVQRVIEQRVIIAGRGMGISEGALIRVMVEIGGIGGGGGFVGFAEMIGGATSREVIHPGGEVAFIAVGVAVFEHALEDDLGDIFGGGAIASIFRQKAEERPVVLLKEFSERIKVALAHGEHEFVVRL